MSVIIQGENLQRILLKIINHRQWTSLMSPAYENYRLRQLLCHPNFLFKPTQIGSYVVEQMNTYKIWPVITSCDSKWCVFHIFKKASKKLWFVVYPWRCYVVLELKKDKILKELLQLQYDQCWTTLSRYGKLPRTIYLRQLESCIYLIIQRSVKRTEHSVLQILIIMWFKLEHFSMNTILEVLSKFL